MKPGTVKYTASEYTDMILIYGECLQNAAETLRVYRERYGDTRRCPTDSRLIYRAVQRLRENQPLVMIKKEGGAGPRKMPINLEERVLKFLSENPSASLRNAAREFKITHKTVRKILDEARDD